MAPPGRSPRGGATGQLGTLAPQLEKALPFEAPALSNAATLLAQNSVRGNTFQTNVTSTFGLVRNNTTMLGQTTSGALRATIPDVYAGGQAPLADIKDVLRLSLTRQLQAEFSVANMTGTSFNIITSTRNVSISSPLATAVQSSGGFIFRVDLATKAVEVWDAANQTWVPFLGGSWTF